MLSRARRRLCLLRCNWRLCRKFALPHLALETWNLSYISARWVFLNFICRIFKYQILETSISKLGGLNHHKKGLHRVVDASDNKSNVTQAGFLTSWRLPSALLLNCFAHTHDICKSERTVEGVTNNSSTAVEGGYYQQIARRLAITAEWGRVIKVLGVHLINVTKVFTKTFCAFIASSISTRLDLLSYCQFYTITRRGEYPSNDSCMGIFPSFQRLPWKQNFVDRVAQITISESAVHRNTMQVSSYTIHCTLSWTSRYRFNQAA